MDPNNQQGLTQPIPVQPSMEHVEVTPATGFPFKKVIGILLGALVVISLVSGAYYLGQKNTPLNTQKSADVVSKTPTPTSDVTAGWQTYTAPTINMTVKYPQLWSVTEKQTQGQVNGVILSGVEGSIDLTWGSSGGFGGACAEGKNQTVDFGGENVNVCVTPNSQGETWGLLYRKVGDITIAATVTIRNCPSNGCGAIPTPVAQQTLERNEQFFRTLLSHITFHQTSIQNWPTYTDTQDGVSIQYPTGWSYDTALFADTKSVAFGPGGYKIPLQTEASVPVALIVRKYAFDDVFKQSVDTFGSTNLKPISAGGLSGFYNGGTLTQPGPGQGMVQGDFMLNDHGKAIEVFYTVYQGVDYKDIASQMVQTIKLTY